MKLSIRFLSIPLMVFTIAGLSACRNTTDTPPDKSLYRTGATADERSIQDAVIDSRKTVELNQGSAKGFVARGSLKYALGNQSGAIEDFTKAIVIEPKSAAAYSGRATAKFSAGDVSGSIADGFEAAKLIVLSKIDNVDTSAVE